MNIDLRNKIDEMLNLYMEISREFKWENHLTNHFAAMTYTIKNKSFNSDRIKSVKDYIKDNTGVFSYYRGHTCYTLSMLLCSEYENPEAKFSSMLVNDKKLKESGFKNNMHLPITNYALLMTCNENEIDSRINKASEIYCEMKKNHPWLTYGDDYPLCILAASKKESVAIIANEMEECYRSLHDLGFSRGNSLQFLSHILSFSGEDVDTKTQRCRNIYDKLKENKLKLYNNYYASLGFLSLLGKESDNAVDMLIDLSLYMKDLKKYKWLGNGTNVLLASGLVCSKFINERKNNKDIIETSIGISIEALIAAQTAASIAAITAASAAASSSN
jgi:hypothetical protein